MVTLTLAVEVPSILMFNICSFKVSSLSPPKSGCHCSPTCAASSPDSDSTNSGSESVGSSAKSSVSYSASTGASVSPSGSATATVLVAPGLFVWLLVTGGFGGEGFFGPGTGAWGGALGLVTLVGLPTCALLGTLAGGGVTTGVPTGIGFGFAGGVGVPPPACPVPTGAFNCCFTFFNFCFCNFLSPLRSH